MKCPKCDAENPDTKSFCGDCGTQFKETEAQSLPTQTIEAPREELTTGSKFAGRYQIIEELGKGGMGKVYKVLDKETNEKIALKLIKSEIASEKKTVERFRNELTTARKIVHKNVCRMYDLNKEEGNYYITMEYVSGGDLKKFIRRSKRLDTGTAISIAKQVCEGLNEAHGLGIVHRDLKPNNIMIDDHGNAKIMDFGIARTVKNKGITGSGVVIGTPEYMSPEQVEAKDVDSRSDIYSLGIILYEMLAGRVPFEGDSALAIGIKHKTETPEDPKNLNPRIPDRLSRLILRCMEKDRETRYQSVGEVRSELEQIEDDLPATAHAVAHNKPLTSKEITVSFSPKKILVPVLSIIAVVVLGISVWQMFLKKDPGSDEVKKLSIAVLPFEDRSPQKNKAPICEQMMIDINRKLNQLGGFDARSRFWVKPLADTGKDPGTIGEELGVSTILVGSIQFDEENMDVEVALLRVGDKRTLWTDRILRKSDEIFSIQNDIVEQIAKALGLTISSEEYDLISRKSTDSTAAYNQYALGRWFYDKRTLEGFEKAIGYYRQAIALDPEYALAYSGLADVYMSQSPDKEMDEKAREAANRALELDDTLAEAYTSRAEIRLALDWDFRGAEEDFKEALALNPKYATAHHWYGRLLSMFGRHEEAIAEMERALELNPTNLSTNRNFAWTLICAHQSDRALLQIKKTYDMDPDFLQVKRIYFGVLIERSMFGEILELFDQDEDRLYTDVTKLLMHAKNNREEALEMLDAIAHTVAGFDAAWIYALLGETDKVFAHLKRSYENRDWNMPFLKATPAFEKYHADPRFEDLLKKMGLDE